MTKLNLLKKLLGKTLAISALFFRIFFICAVEVSDSTLILACSLKPKASIKIEFQHTA